MKEFIKRAWIYIVAFVIPWFIVIVHSFVRDSWLSGEGSLLIGDAGNVYYPMYMELWDMVHSGDVLAFSWNIAAGMDFVQAIFQYMFSPFTILILITPKAYLLNLLQVIIVLKWSCMIISMTYYAKHTKWNELKEHRNLISLVIAVVYGLSNVTISNLQNLASLDMWIIFPLLIFFIEQMRYGKGYKRFYVFFTLALLSNYRGALILGSILLVWFILSTNKQMEKKNNIRFVWMYIASYLSSALVLVPMYILLFNQAITVGWDKNKVMTPMALYELVHRFFVCDALLYDDAHYPMLYCSIVAVVCAMLYVFLKTSLKEKILVVLLFLISLLGIWLDGMQMILPMFYEEGDCIVDFSFCLVFIIAHMFLRVVGKLQDVKKYVVFACLTIGLMTIVYTFFNVKTYLDFYVYLASTLLLVFTFMMIFFFCKKSIQYKNILIVLAVVCLTEMLVNAYMHIEVYNMYNMDEIYYHAQADALVKDIDVANGARVAIMQNEANYGQVLSVATVSVENDTLDKDIGNLYEKLGFATNGKYYEVFGASPVLNTMFNIQYGFGSSEVGISDARQVQSKTGYNLYQMNYPSAVGYMIDSDIQDWNVEKAAPFDVQNDFIRLATGVEGVFEEVTPTITCQSLLGGGRELEEHDHVHDENCEHSAEEDVYNIDYTCRYDTVQSCYPYHYIKMYSEDVVTMSFVAEESADYYVFIDSDANCLHNVYINGMAVHTDVQSSFQKLFHIGEIETGTEIRIVSNAEVNDLSDAMLRYRIAKFSKEQYLLAYEKMLLHPMEISSWSNGEITGTIEVSEDGVMMTSIPALNGFQVFVDGKRQEHLEIGKALIGVKLDEGQHDIEIRYEMSGLKLGVIFLIIGVSLLVLYMIIFEKQKQAKVA